MRKCKVFPIIRGSNALPNRTVLFEAPQMSTLFVETLDSGKDGRQCTHFINDVTLLFNQERISKCGNNAADIVKSWLSRLQTSSSSLDELRKKCSDEDLVSIVKSRYIQTPSELLAWSSYLSSHVDEVLADIAKEQSNDNSNIVDKNDSAGTPAGTE